MGSRVWMWIIVDKQTAMGKMGKWVFKTKQSKTENKIK